MLCFNVAYFLYFNLRCNISPFYSKVLCTCFVSFSHCATKFFCKPFLGIWLMLIFSKIFLFVKNSGHCDDFKQIITMNSSVLYEIKPQKAKRDLFYTNIITSQKTIKRYPVAKQINLFLVPFCT